MDKITMHVHGVQGGTTTVSSAANDEAHAHGIDGRTCRNAGFPKHSHEVWGSTTSTPRDPVDEDEELTYPDDLLEMARTLATETVPNILQMSDEELAADMEEARSHVCECSHIRAYHRLGDEVTRCFSKDCECEQYNEVGDRGETSTH